MFRTRGRKILRDIWSRKARTALVAVSIFIGVFGTVTLFTMGDLVVRQLEDDLKQDRLAMTRSYLGVVPGSQPDNAALLASLRALPDVTTAEGQAVYPFFWKKSGDTDFSSGTLLAHSEPFGSIQLEPMRLVDGEFPLPGQQQIAVERRFADRHGLSVGDTIVVRALSQAAEGQAPPEETWTITATVFFAYGYQGMVNPVPEAMAFATYDDAQHIANFKGFSSVYLRYASFTAAEAHAADLESAIAASGTYIPAFTLSEDPADNSLIAFAQTSASVMGSLALLALIVSGFLVFNVLTAIVAEQRQQIGVMKTLGATRPDSFAIYSGMALVYGIIGVIPGVLLGIPSGYFAAQGFAASANSLIDSFGYSTRAIVIGVLVGLAVPVLASLLPVLNGTRIRIIEAITDLGIASRYGYGPLARVVKALPVPVTMRQGISNVIRKKGRMALTVITLTLAAGAFMGVYAVFASVDQVINDFFNTYGFNFSIDPSDTQQVAAAQEAVLAAMPELESVGPFVNMEISIDGYDKEYDPASGPPALFASGYDPASGAFDIKLVEGHPLGDDENEVIITRSIAESIEVGPGDSITVRAAGHSGQYQIAGISSFPYDAVWFHWRALSALSGVVSPQGEPVPASVLIRMDRESPTASEVDDVLNEVNEVLLAKGMTASYQNIEQFKEQLSNTIATFRFLFNFTAGLIALVGAVGLLTTLSMSVFERQKEIGVMRSIGAGSTSIITQFLTEGIMVGLIAWAIGLPISYFLNTGLIAALNLGDEYNLGYPLTAALLGLVGMLLITVVASLWPSVAAARKTVSNILRYQ